MRDLIHLVSSVPLFSGLAYEHRRSVANVAKVQEFQKGEVLFHEDQIGDAFFVVLQGRVRLHKTSPDGREAVIKIMGPGESFAEVVLFEAPRYPVTAISLTRALVLKILRTDLHRLLDHQEFRNDFIAMLMRKQRYLAERIRDVTACPPEQRLIRFLTTQFGPGPVLEVPILKKHIAAALDITPETLSRLVRRLQQERILEWKGRRVRLRPQSGDSSS